MTSDPLIRIRKKLLLYKILFASTLIILCVLLVHTHFDYIENTLINRGIPPLPPPPHKNEIMKIIEPLRYSGIERLLKDEVTLAIDFEKYTWCIKNIHRYDEQGHIVLENDRAGLCGELATFVYERILPFFKNHYVIKFVQVAESGFFQSANSSHFILTIASTPPLEPNTYIIGPTFKRYGYQDECMDYLHVADLDPAPFLSEHDPNACFQNNSCAPILIRNDFLVALCLESINDVFTADNFSIILAAAKKHQFVGRPILLLRRVNGQTELMENKYLAGYLFPSADYQRLKQKLIDTFGRYTGVRLQ